MWLEFLPVLNVLVSIDFRTFKTAPESAQIPAPTSISRQLKHINMEYTKPVLVVGASGILGSEICRQMTAAKKKVRALVRPETAPQKIQMLEDLGVSLVYGDLKDRGSLAEACDGVSAVISTASSTLSRTEGDSIETVDRQGQLSLVEAAEQAFIDKFIYISFAESELDFPLQDAKRQVEDRLMESNMDFTILRPSFFMEVWLSPNLGFDPQNGKVSIYGHGAGKVSWIAVQDVARFAIASLENSAAINSIIELGGPEALTQLEVVKIFETHAGRTFEIQYVPENALRTQWEVTPEPLQKSFAALMLMLTGNNSVDMTDTLQAFPGRLRSVEEYCRSIMATEARAGV
jgi:uncharacterized protein YbjT (DUF2867 family)